MANDNINLCNFCLGSVSKDFPKDEKSEFFFFLNGTVYDFSFDHSSVKKEDIHNVLQYLMVRNKCLILFKKYLSDY